MTALMIGLMSGTSMDGIDAVVLDVDRQLVKGSYFLPYSSELRQRISALANGEVDSVHALASLDRELALLYAEAVKHLLKRSGLEPTDIEAIGCHGQTLRHHVIGAAFAYTVQIGDPNTLAAETGMTVVADFRRADVANGGQGAPLAPLYHQQLFLSADKRQRVVLNLGGIANISYLNSRGEASGFDVGPGNALLDLWAQIHLGTAYDAAGRWASQGQCHPSLLNALMNDNYFSLPSPKSIAKEYFNLAWLDSYLASFALSPRDVQATLVELTALSVKEAIKNHGIACEQLVVCGGGAKNAALLARLFHHVGEVVVSDALGVDSDFIEAMMVAWLASLTLKRRAVSTNAITGAKRSVVLGGIYYSPQITA